VKGIFRNSLTPLKDQMFMGIEQGEEVQTKGIHNVFNKITTENLENYAHQGTGSLQDTKQT
jgi:hypothetical protein